MHRQAASLMRKLSAAYPLLTTTIGRAPILPGRTSCVNSAGVVLFAAQPRRGDAASSKLPARGEFTIANAYVMTMDGALGDIAGGAVHVRNGEIVAIGKDVKGGGQKIDGTGMIVMPGLVETHWHMWNTLYRSFS